MNKKNKRDRAGFALVEMRILDSPVFRDLTKTAMLVLLDFLSLCRYENRNFGKRRIRTLTNNGALVYTFDQAEEKGIPRASFNRAVHELIDCGFLSIREQGSGVHREANHYALDERWVHWGTERFEKVVKPPPRLKIGFKKGHRFFPSRRFQSTTSDTNSSTADDTSNKAQVSSMIPPKEKTG